MQNQQEFPSLKAAKSYYKSCSTQLFFLSSFSGRRYFSFFSLFLPAPDYKEHIAFVYLVSNCLSAGFSLLESLCLVYQQIQNLKLKLCMGSVIHGLIQGQKYSELLGFFPRVFPMFYVAVIKAGEFSGSLEQSMDSLLCFYETKYGFSKQMRQLMFYPIIIFFFLILLICFFIVFIAPQFKLLLGDLETFPLPSRILFSIADFFTVYYGLFFIGLFSFFGICFLLTKIVVVKQMFHFFLLKIPLVGLLIRDFVVFQFIKILDVLFTNQVSLIDSLLLVQTSVRNAYFQKMFVEMHHELRIGRSMRLALMRYSSILPSLVFYSLSTGEKAGSFSILIVRLSVFSDRELRYRIKRFSSVFNPLVTVILGGTVIFMMLAIYLPFMDMITNLLSV